MWYKAFIYDDKQGVLIEHIAKDTVTACGITWDSLPDIVAADGEVWVGDKAWYADHDVPYDVPKCTICPIRVSNHET